MNSGEQHTSESIANAITMTRPWQSQTPVGFTSRSRFHPHVQHCQVGRQQLKARIPWNLLRWTRLSRNVLVAVKAGQPLEPSDVDFCIWLLSRRGHLGMRSEACNQRHITAKASKTWTCCGMFAVSMLLYFKDTALWVLAFAWISVCVLTVFLSCPWLN